MKKRQRCQILAMDSPSLVIFSVPNPNLYQLLHERFRVILTVITFDKQISALFF